MKILEDIESNCVISIFSEKDLQKSVVKYLRENHPDVLFCANGFSSDLDSDEKRIDKYKLGYTPGIPDVMIYKKSKSQKYSGMALELKTPYGCGVISPQQNVFCERLAKEGWFVLITNSYSSFIEEFTKYVYLY